jgi:hypothetical protein
MDEETSVDHPMIREWFERSRFSTYEAESVFDALEEITDFTCDTVPDVVLVDVDSAEKNVPIFRAGSSGAELPIMAIGDDETCDVSKNFFHADLGNLALHLDKLIPH